MALRLSSVAVLSGDLKLTTNSVDITLTDVVVPGMRAVTRLTLTRRRSLLLCRFCFCSALLCGVALWWWWWCGAGSLQVNSKFGGVWMNRVSYGAQSTLNVEAGDVDITAQVLASPPAFSTHHNL